MKKVFAIGVGLMLAVIFGAAARAQKESALQRSVSSSEPKASTEETDPPLVLTEAIPLENAKGRFDHFGAGKGKLFVSALGSNAVEVIDIGRRILEHTITGVPYSQGVTFSPEANKLFVASGEGRVYIYDGSTYNLITTIDFEGGADNLRYDAATKRVYVACGDDEKTGAIATIDAVTNQRLEEEYKLGGEPESFQLERSGPNIYVNVPPLKQIVVVNRATKEIKRWPLPASCQESPDCEHLFIASVIADFALDNLPLTA